jgi:hypothetical protein
MTIFIYNKSSHYCFLTLIPVIKFNFFKEVNPSLTINGHIKSNTTALFLRELFPLPNFSLE